MNKSGIIMPSSDVMKDVIIYNTSQIQQIFDCGKKQAYELMCSPGFPSFRINSKHYITKDALLNWLESQKGKTFYL